MIAGFLYVLSRYKTAHPIELIILGVAAVSYLLLANIPPELWLQVRYIDWFITVPLLVYTVASTGDVPYWVSGSLAVGMLLMGYIAISDKKRYNQFILAGFVFYAAFFVTLLLSNLSVPRWFLIFFASWAIYGVVDRLEGPRDHWAYTILDLVNKPVFIALLLTQM